MKFIYLTICFLLLTINGEEKATFNLEFYSTSTRANSHSVQKIIKNTNNKIYITEETELKQQHIESAQTKMSKQGQTYIHLTLTDKGRKIFSELTRKYIGTQIAILINNEVIYAPVIQTFITSGTLSIKGNLTKTEVKEIVKKINLKQD